MTAADRNTTADALDRASREMQDNDPFGWAQAIQACDDAARLLRTPDTPTDSDTAAQAELDEYPCFMDLMEMQERLAPLADYLDALGFDHDAELVRRMLFPTGTVADLRAERDAAVARADRLDAAIRHHQSEGGGNMSADWDLWAAADRGTDR